MTTQYTIRCAGFEPNQQASISAILDLADSALSSIWIIIDSTDSDVLMINMDSEAGQQVFSGEKNNRPRYRFILATEATPDSELDQYWVLTQNSNDPPSLKELTKLLNDVAEVLNHEAKMILEQTDTLENTDETVSSPSVEEPPAAPTEQQAVIASVVEDKELQVAENNDTFDFTTLPSLPKNSVALTRPLYARNYFFGMLVRAQKNKACRIIKQTKLPNLYLWPSENRYYFAGSATELQAYCTAMPQHLEESIITKQKLAKMLKSGQLVNPQPLDALVVYAIIEVSQGRLLEGHSAEQAFTLTQMPDFGQMPMLAEYKRLGDYLYKQTSNLFQAAETLNKPLSAVFDFYNVCYLLGYVSIETATNLAPPDVSKTNTPVIVMDEKKSGKLGDFLKNLFVK